MTVRLGAPDLERIARTPPSGTDITVLAAGTHVARIHRLGGRHPAAWDELRHWGPVPRARFDPHPEPAGDHDSHGVVYLTYGPDAVTAAIGEAFANDVTAGPIDRERDRPNLAISELAAHVTVIDLDSGWVTRAGGNQAITTGPRARARAWARAVHATFPDIAGFAYGSSVWGPGRCAALWERARSVFPPHPLLHRELRDVALDDTVAHAAGQLGTSTIG